MKPEKVIVLLSGGLNSAVATALALKQNYEVIALSIYYGQGHARELRAAQLLVDHYAIEQYFISSVDMHLWTGSTLAHSNHAPSISAIAIDQQASPLYVPNRNMIFLSIALSLAEAKGAKRIYIGLDQRGNVVHDCYYTARRALNKMLELSTGSWFTQDFTPLVETPLLNHSKLDIVKLAVNLDVPIDLTWSCSQCLSTPCGICSSCRSRNEALNALGLPHLATPMARSYV